MGQITLNEVTKMKLTNFQVLNALQSLNLISQTKLPIKFAWKVATAIRSLEQFSRALEMPMQEIREKYAMRNSDGVMIEAENEKGEKIPNTIQIPNEKIAIVNAEINGLLEETVEVSNVELKLSDFPDDIKLEPVVLSGLTPLIKEEA